MPKIQETSSGSTWTARENKLFENELAVQDENSPDRWQNIAKVTGKTVEEVKAHYQLLVEDLELIESGQVPLPNYKDDIVTKDPVGPTASNAPESTFSRYSTKV